MNTFLTRTLPLLLCILVGTVLSWVSIYIFFFAVWTFHSLPVARFADAAGNLLLFPARQIFAFLGGDQSTLFYDPISFSGTNGLIIGILLYVAFRAIWTRRENGKKVVARQEERLEARVG